MAGAMFACAFCANPQYLEAANAKGGTVAETTTQTVILLFLAFLVLEVSVGIYFPSIGYLRGEVIPDGLRANIMNWFRVPMNILTCGGLMGMHQFEHPRANQVLFLLCGLSALLGFVLSRRFSLMKSSAKKTVLSIPLLGDDRKEQLGFEQQP